MNKLLKVLEQTSEYASNIASFIALSLFGITVSVIGVCILIIVSSFAIQCVTGYSLINDTIKPLFGH